MALVAVYIQQPHFIDVFGMSGICSLVPFSSASGINKVYSGLPFRE